MVSFFRARAKKSKDVLLLYFFVFFGLKPCLCVVKFCSFRVLNITKVILFAARDCSSPLFVHYTFPPSPNIPSQLQFAIVGHPAKVCCTARYRSTRHPSLRLFRSFVFPILSTCKNTNFVLLRFPIELKFDGIVPNCHLLVSWIHFGQNWRQRSQAYPPPVNHLMSSYPPMVPFSRMVKKTH